MYTIVQLSERAGRLIVIFVVTVVILVIMWMPCRRTEQS